jgi:hypothetical protein
MAVVAGGTLPLLLLLLLNVALCSAHGEAASKEAPSLLLHINNSKTGIPNQVTTTVLWCCRKYLAGARITK